MDLYDAINRRHSIRDFTDEPIPEDTVRRIIQAAFKAPSNDHLRDWHFIVVTDKKILGEVLAGIPKDLSEKDVDAMTFLSDPVQKACYKDAVPKQHRMLYEAAAVIVPLLKKKTDILHPQNLSSLNCYATIWCSIENLWLAATAEGYGCNVRIPLGNEEAVAQKVLGFPDGYMIPCFIGIGRPAPDAVIARQLDADIGEQLHWQKF